MTKSPEYIDARKDARQRASRNVKSASRSEPATLCGLLTLGEVTAAEYNAAIDYAVRLAARDQRINLNEALSMVRSNSRNF